VNPSPSYPPQARSGKTYATPPGFVYTSYQLLDPKAPSGVAPNVAGFWSRVNLSKTHPSWFWPRAGSAYGQLCWSNESMVDFIVKNVKGLLRNSPDANYISVRPPP
jgi:hypothetical protein